MRTALHLGGICSSLELLQKLVRETMAKYLAGYEVVCGLDTYVPTPTLLFTKEESSSSNCLYVDPVEEQSEEEYSVTRPHSAMCIQSK